MVSEASARPKRTRSQHALSTVDEDGRTDDRSDNSSDQAEPEDSSDDMREGRSRAKRVRATEAASYSIPKNLIDVIKGNGKPIPQVVKQWVERYEKDSRSAMVDLLMMLFEACGAKYYVEGDFLDKTDVDDVVVALVNFARNGEVEDYQSSKKKEFQNFKDNLISFWDNLVRECQNGPLFDQVLFEKCMDYIIALSCTPPRVYRQVSSLMGLQLVTSFITVAKMYGAQRETIQRQLNAENKKQTQGRKTEAPRLESLNKRLSITHEKITLLENMMRKIFTGLFIHRYRDIDPNIRMSCIEFLGIWILSYPSMFLQDLYLKYLGWTLNDKSAAVRKASVLALQGLYEVDDIVPSLGLFTERFSNRMIEIADDVDISVAVSAIGLVKQLLRNQLLLDDDLGPLYDLLIDESAEIRHAIGALVYEHLIAQKFNSALPHSGNDSAEEHLGRMLQILREFSADPILINYVIDDVWEYMNAMKEWKCIISMLLDENPSNELNEADATNLIRLLYASVKKATGEKIVPVTDNRKQNYTKAQKEIFETCRQDVTLSMMKNYPLLLQKFMADKEKIPPLIEIMLHMNLELYSLKRQEQNFKSVIDLVKEAFFKYGEKDVLRSSVKVMNFCAMQGHGELQDFAQNKFQELENDLIAKLNSAIKDVMEGFDEYSLLVSLKRLYELQLSHNVPIVNLFDDLAGILRSSRNMDDEVASFLLLNMYLHVAWCLHSIVNNRPVSEEELSCLVSKRDSLVKELYYFLRATSETPQKIAYGKQLACRVCTIVAETWCLFRKSNFASTKLLCLGYCPDTLAVQMFWELCEEQLNLSDETEGEDNIIEYVEEINRDAVMIAAAKLVAGDVVPRVFLGSEIVSHYLLHGASIAEIVKHLIVALKKKEGDIPGIFIGALKKVYQRQATSAICKDLASRLSGSFLGASRNKHKAEILKILKEGIEFALQDPPDHLSFLEVALLQFVTKLHPTDILYVLKDIQKQTENMNMDRDPISWQPYNRFMASLREKCAKKDEKKDELQDEKEGPSVRRRRRTRKRGNLQGKKLFDGQSSDEDDPISESDHDAEEDEENQPEQQAVLTRSSSKLRSLRLSSSRIGGPTRSQEPVQAASSLPTSTARG